MEFLRDRSARELCYDWREYSILLLKSAYDEDTEFLYSMYQYKEKTPWRVGEDAKYMGIYSRLSDMVVGVVQGLDRSRTTNPEDVLKAFEADVIQRICRTVGGKPVPTTEKAEPLRDDHEYFLRYGAQDEALKLFYGDNCPPVYKPYFKLDTYSTANFIDILHRREKTIQQFAERFILKNANAINDRLWQISVVTEKLRELNATPGEHHIHRKIAQSIDPKLMKTVSVKVKKDGKEMSGKIDAIELARANGNNYATYRMDAPTRRTFERTFGRSAELYASDIVRIAYGRKTLYAREDKRFEV